MYVVCVFVCLQFLQIHGFNFDTSNPIVYVDPGRVQNASKSYFGYTVVLYPGHKELNEKWIKIGAPNGADPQINNIKNPGVVYNCPYMERCNTVDVRKGHRGEITLNNEWLGGTMDIHYEFNRLAICAFRKTYESIRDKDYRAIGSCYLSYLNITYDKVEPLDDINKQVHENRVYNYGQGEAGFSAHFPTKENALLLGAPGVYNWVGTAINITDYVFDDPIASRQTAVRHRRGLQNRIVSVANPRHGTVSVSYELFGYSINSGYFYGLNELYSVASAPKSNIYRGKVVIFLFGGNDEILINKESKVGSQFGEYFGASIAVGDINSDGCDDLIVGAPYHAVDTYNEGSVYIFLGQRQGQLKKYDPLYGQKTNGQFGSSIMFLGDIDHDGYGDIAIGAPYEEDFSGVLYIYKGNKQGLEKQPCQRIIGKDVSPEIRGFGISISRPADMDGNKYKDLAVGAYLSGNVVLLRSIPVIVVKYDMVTFPKELKSESRTFILQVCYWYTHYDEADIAINRTIIVDELIGRATIYNNQKDNLTTITLKTMKTVCENITISLKNATTTMKLAPVTVSLSYELKRKPQKKEVMYFSDNDINGTDNLCVRCPVLDEFRSTRPDTIRIPFTLDCGDDNICQSNLTMEAKISNLSENTFVVGSLDSVNLSATIKNWGEKAYSTQLEVILPEIINFRQILSECQEQNSSVIICNVEDPLRENKEKTIDLELDMDYVNKNNFETQYLNIRLRVLTTSKNNNTDTIFFKLHLKTEADVTIYGKSAEQSLAIGNITHGMPNFTQIFQVEKTGASPLEKVSVNITIPHAIKTPDGSVSFIQMYQPVAIFNGQPVICESKFSYIQEPKSEEMSEKLITFDTLLRRRRRQTNNLQQDKKQVRTNDKEYEIVPNRTYFLNCSMEDILCSPILCTGSFDKKQNPTVIQVKMMLNTSAIQGILGTKDMVLYSTHGSVIIEKPSGFVQNGNRPDSVEVSTLFINEMVRKKKVALWIIILSVIAGLLLLVLIIYGLTKAGFFKRAKKEELKNLKAAMEGEDEIQETSDDAFEPVANPSTEGLVDEGEENEK